MVSSDEKDNNPDAVKGLYSCVYVLSQLGDQSFSRLEQDRN